MKLDALAFLLPLALYVSPLFYSYDTVPPKSNEHPTMVTRTECEAALSDSTLVIRVDLSGREQSQEPLDMSICESLGEQYVAVGATQLEKT